VEEGGQQVTGDESADDADDDIDQQVRAVMHEFSRDPADDCSYEDPNEKTDHFALSFENISEAWVDRG
jgi:hypothetical protein